jgi:hypothetical protein
MLSEEARNTFCTSLWFEPTIYHIQGEPMIYHIQGEPTIYHIQGEPTIYHIQGLNHDLSHPR